MQSKAIGNNQEQSRTITRIPNQTTINTNHNNRMLSKALEIQFKHLQKQSNSIEHIQKQSTNNQKAITRAQNV